MRIHVLDFNNGVPNRGTAALLRLLPGDVCVWRVRDHGEVPPDEGVWVLTGGPGSPLEEGGWRAPVCSALVRRADTNAPTFGICYGFELLAATFGAELRKVATRRFGVMPLRLTAAGRADSLFCAFDGAPTWENRSWGVYGGEGETMATSDLGDRVAVRFAPRVVGVMFHPEADEEGVRGVMATSGVHADPTGLDRVHLGLLAAFVREARS